MRNLVRLDARNYSYSIVSSLSPRVLLMFVPQACVISKPPPITCCPTNNLYLRLQVGPVEGYLVMSGPVAALDAARRVLYWVGQRSNAGAQDPFFLIGVSLDTAAVVSSAQLCASDDQCPWSLEFYAG